MLITRKGAGTAISAVRSPRPAVPSGRRVRRFGAIMFAFPDRWGW